MRFLSRILALITATIAVLGSPSAATAVVIPDRFAMAHSYSGNWPVTVTRSERSNGTSCLMLTDNGGNGSRHSGSASLVFRSNQYSGTFQLINGLLVATIEVPGVGQNAGFVFIGSASRGNIGPGVFDEVYGGEAFDEGALAFGMKGSC